MTTTEIYNNIVKQIESDYKDRDQDELKNLMLIGLVEEVGEVAGLQKRAIRGYPKDLQRCTEEKFVEELGDVLWYFVGVLHTHGFTIDDIVKYNNEKLEARYGTY